MASIGNTALSFGLGGETSLWHLPTRRSPFRLQDLNQGWIVDHTVRIGEVKRLIIVGFRLGVWRQLEDRTLAYEGVGLIGLWPVRTSTGEIVDGLLESAIARTGLPCLVISDDGPSNRIASGEPARATSKRFDTENDAATTPITPAQAMVPPLHPWVTGCRRPPPETRAE